MQKTPHHAPAGYDWVTKVDDWKHSGDSLHMTVGTAHGQTAHLSFQALTPEIWRLTFRPRDAQLLSTPMVVGLPEVGVGIEVHESQGKLVTTGSCLSLEIRRNPWQIQFRDPNGAEVLRENPSDIDGLGRPFVLPLGFVADSDGLNQITESFHLRPDEHLFGLGEKFTPLDKVGQRIITWTQDAFGSTSERSHKNIPFLMSTRGYGLLLDSGAHITWDLGVSSCQSYTITAEAESLDAYVIYGPSLAAILERYTLLTGRAPVPPKWTFGLWLSSTGAYRDQAAMERLVEGLETHDIPVDVIHVDTWWMKWRTYCDFRWDREAFPDVEGFIAGLHQQGYKLSL
jgi:alpha-D-xyloside xylohydrolase